MKGVGGEVKKVEEEGGGGEGERLLMEKGDGQEEGEGFHTHTVIKAD